ncbi:MULTISPECIES: hypothetical protein [unclassified Luteibacter]|uniref:hypothetical protein n=1 Tax=Luteibacter sp. PvP019 TaxID=3156436 RepID=UPI0033946A9C
MIKLLAIIAVGFVVALIVQHMNAGRDARRAEAHPPLIVTEEHGWTTIMTTPAPLPARVAVVSWLLALAVGATGAALGTHVDPDSPLPVIFGLAAWIGGGLVISKLHKAAHDVTRKVQRQPFQVSRLGIRLSDGTLLAPGQIYGIRRGNTQAGDQVVMGGAGMVAGVSQMAAESSQRLARVSHTVEVDHGGRATVLAGGLTETQAHAVASEITQRLPGFR